ncbi:unnamed protein product [Parnassius apollo]|uniref:(apollo) hypothetical protein n=1 Tax=Parnassius apollo TaxID=110799 RepID=A0A8S3X3M7_PARAO|nr:unnamed protein product [Parnassius apollo]
MKLREFRLEVAKELCWCGPSIIKKRGRPSSFVSDMLDVRIKRKPKLNVPPKDVKTDGMEHFPIWSNIRKRWLTSNVIAEVLNDSEFDYSGDDTDKDPEFHPPEINQTIRDHAQSESSSSSEDEDDLVTSVASPTVSDNSDSPSTSSYLLRARGRARNISQAELWS